jgi:hypothetical protein
VAFPCLSIIMPPQQRWASHAASFPTGAAEATACSSASAGAAAAMDAAAKVENRIRLNI